MSIDEKFLKPYDPKETEARIYKLWEESGFFKPEGLPCVALAKQGKIPEPKPFTVMIAPPNVTGSLHMGHALENTLADIMVRLRRMQGYKTLWLPGTDHAGIATQNAVEKELRKEGLSRHDLGREKFIEKVWEWKEKYGGVILDQLKRLGCSFDWSRTRFTMDEPYQQAVREAFLRYQKEGLVYRGERVINWCVKDQTAISDLELEYEEEKTKFYYFKYGPFVIGTARPETKFGDKYVVMHPNDERYSEYKHGQKINLEWINGSIIATVIKDSAIDTEFGTGVMTITPSHSIEDFEIAERHNLEKEKIIDGYGKLLPIAGEFAGIKASETRTKIVEKLREKGLLEKEEEYVHNIAKCYRCKNVVEPMLSKQWFIKMKPLAEKVISAIESGQINYHPERWKEISLEWLRNVRDWCISRQIWWGHKIPSDEGNDVFDTWFSSALWPFATLGWPEKSADFKNYYPTQFITSGRDILHLWISRMIFSGLFFTGQIPFRDIFIHATVLNKSGQRMSKSLGTGLDPLDMIEKYGADATRFGLAYQTFGGQDIRFGEDNILMGKKFANKLWNIARFVLEKNDGKFGSQTSRNSRSLTSEDTEILNALKKLEEETTELLNKYEFGEATHRIYDFVWHTLADQYIEASKKRTDEEVKQILNYVLIEILKLLHPFMPFVTEEIWDTIGKKNLLMIEPWSIL